VVHPGSHRHLPVWGTGNHLDLPPSSPPTARWYHSPTTYLSPLACDFCESANLPTTPRRSLLPNLRLDLGLARLRYTRLGMLTGGAPLRWRKEYAAVGSSDRLILRHHLFHLREGPSARGYLWKKTSNGDGLGHNRWAVGESQTQKW